MTMKLLRSQGTGGATGYSVGPPLRELERGIEEVHVHPSPLPSN